jgi:hypothetical protein
LLAGQQDAITQDFVATSHSVTSVVRNVNVMSARRAAYEAGSGLRGHKPEPDKML